MKKKMQELKQYTQDFIKGEDGMELLQLAIAVVLVVGLIAVVGYLFYAISQKIGDAGDEVMGMDTKNLQQYNNNPNNSNSTQATTP